MESNWAAEHLQVIRTLMERSAVYRRALAPIMIYNGVVWLDVTSAPLDLVNVLAMLWLPLSWVILYGCAFHAAGFFMPRGMRLFGWALILGGCAGFAFGVPDGVDRLVY